MSTDRVGKILWGEQTGRNPKPYLCLEILESWSQECYALIDLECNIRMTLSVRDVNKVIVHGQAWWDDRQLSSSEEDDGSDRKYNTTEK